MKIATLRPFVSAVVFALGMVTASAAVTFTDEFSSLDPSTWNIGFSGTVASITAIDGAVRVHQAANHYANLYTSAGSDVHYIQADIRNANDTGASWAPGLSLYFDENNWVQFGLRRTDRLQIRYSLGNQAATIEFSPDYAWSVGEWYTLRIEIADEEQQIRLWIGKQGAASLTLLSEYTQALPASFNGESTIILGKGVGYSPYDANEFLRNNFTGASGNYGYSYFDNVVIASAIPEPAYYGLLSVGFLGVGLLRRNKRLRDASAAA